MRLFASLWCVLAVLHLSARPAAAAEPGDWDDPDWQLLREAHVPRDGAGLAAYLRGLGGDGAEPARLDALVRGLGDADFDAREKAGRDLAAVGVPALGRLREACADPDAEVSRRAAACVAQIEKMWRAELALAAVRVLARRAPADAVPALLHFLPCADSEEMRDAVWFGLDALTAREGKPDPSLTDALRDPVTVRRAAAACVVGRRGDADRRAAVRKLLSDAEAEVRLRAAQGLLAARDAAGVPALIALLEGTPVETAWQAEELLRYVAGKEAPAPAPVVGAGGDRASCRKAWEAWWKDHAATLDLAALDATDRRPGLVLLCDGGLPEAATGRVWLLGCDGVTRWDLRGLSYPSDARLLPDGHVLVAERPLTSAQPKAEAGVTARGLDGKELWRYQGVEGPTACQPMPDGRVLVAGAKLAIAELDAAGNEVVQKSFAATNFPDFSHDSYWRSRRVLTCRPKDGSNARDWREVGPGYPRRISESPAWTWFFGYVLSADGIERLPNLETCSDAWSRVEVRAYVSHVEQYGDPNRRSYNPWVWMVRMPGVIEAAKLPNRNVTAGGVGRVIEIDHEGQVVWSASFEEQAQRVRPFLNLVRLGFDAPRKGMDLTADQSAWLHGLVSKVPAVRRRTAEAVGALGRWGQEAGPSLVPLLKDADDTVRDAARGALALVYPVIPPAQRQALNSKDPKVRHEAEDSFKLIPRPPQDAETDARDGSLKDEWFVFLMGQLKDGDCEWRWEVANSLCGEELHAREVIPALTEALHDPDAKVRAYAAGSLRHFGPDARAAIPALAAGLKDNDEWVRGWSAHALCEIDPSDERAFPALLEAVQDQRRDNHYVACALSRCGSRAKEAVPVLLKMLDARNYQLPQKQIDANRWEVLNALRRLAPAEAGVVPALAALVRDKSVDLNVRLGAARNLGELRTLAESTLPDLESAKDDQDLAAVAEEAIQKIQDQ